MTDKQIIIDGVDVSKCKYIDIENFEKPICHCISQRNECEMPCEYNKDCYFKQLARMKRELEAKDKECEELKKRLESFQKDYSKLYQVVENKGYIKELDQLKIENNQFKQTLAEIKEIAENMNNECFYSDFDCKYCDMKNGCTYFNKKQILQKIRECEVGND